MSHDRDFESHEIMEAIARTPPAYRDAVVAVDLIGLSYREAASALRTRESTITTRLHRGRQYVARALKAELPYAIAAATPGALSPGDPTPRLSRRIPTAPSRYPTTTAGGGPE